MINKNKVISILIPVFNEEHTIAELLTSVLKLNVGSLRKEIVVVNDASTDGTLKIIQTIAKLHKNINIYSHIKNKGKGAALKTAISHANGEIVVIQDADLEYPAINIVKIIKPILNGNADVVFGSRKLKREKKYSSFTYYIGGAIIDRLIKYVLHASVSDAICGPKAFRMSVFKIIGKIESKRFEIDTELTAKIVKSDIQILDVPIIYNPRTHSDGKKIKWYDSISIVRMLIKSRNFKPKLSPNQK